jgi:hypothetical protein
VVPASEPVADYRQRILSFIPTLSEREEGHAVAVREDILAARRQPAAKNSADLRGGRRGVT